VIDAQAQELSDDQETEEVEAEITEVILEETVIEVVEEVTPESEDKPDETK
jgi:hypothetical protein